MLLDDGSWICDFCGDPTPAKMNEHENCVGMLKMLLFERLGHEGYTQEKRVHVIAECITRNFIQEEGFTRRLKGANRMQWAVAYDTAVDWIVRDGGHAVLLRVASERLSVQPDATAMLTEATARKALTDVSPDRAIQSRPAGTLDTRAAIPDPWEE